MDPVVSQRLRRQGPLFATLALFAFFLAAHLLLFQPLVARYRSALSSAAALGLTVDPSRPPTEAPLAPRVFSLLMDNSLPAREADLKLQSGALAGEMVQTLSALAARHGLEVVVAEPGLQTPQANSVELRAHLRLRGSYPSFVALLDDLATGGGLWMVERFRLVPGASHRQDIEIWLASCWLKRAQRAS